jgi:hypothetical protein
MGVFTGTGPEGRHEYWRKFSGVGSLVERESDALIVAADGKTSESRVLDDITLRGTTESIQFLQRGGEVRHGFVLPAFGSVHVKISLWGQRPLRADLDPNLRWLSPRRTAVP